MAKAQARKAQASKAQANRVLELVEHGIEVRIASGDGHGRSTCHQKICVVDAEHFYVGSGNASNNSRRTCYEYGLITRSQPLCIDMVHRMEGLWRRAKVLTVAGARKCLEDRDAKSAKEAEARAEKARSKSSSAARGSSAK